MPVDGSDGRWGNWQTRLAFDPGVSGFETWAASYAGVAQLARASAW